MTNPVVFLISSTHSLNQLFFKLIPLREINVYIKNSLLHTANLSLLLPQTDVEW